ncbi:T9SS type A sorting domain-containing protein [Polaribacter sargassicola]|uniref:T9SS type A sorting domain-containing protein n=1 Tax=Polaribacter sargassicola TaxID=2836891 RepID=UPI001F2D88AD|nr:T9SS type A sorting domain-containing protein [Polaribacter sp. DS7-9]MCG1035809.1 T9SS type A sorting domain-containing protein [Polaribacter sp. DS7-9]
MKLRITIILLIFMVNTYSQTSIININPSELNQEVVFGGDNKLTIKSWAEGNTDEVSRKLFLDIDLKILRVPIFALQTIDDPIYDNVIKVINSVKVYNPEVKIFASIANGDGYGVNHHGASKFPSGWTGCCDYNVYSLNITAYSKYLDSFMERMTDAGITIDYLGPYNEDPGDDSDYVKIINQMTKLGDTKMVGVERWALLSSVAAVDDIEDRVDVVGSHFYDDTTIDEANWDSSWESLVAISEDPVWYTESTRYSTGDNIDLLIAGMDNIFAPIRGGVESIIFYQVCKRFVYANGSKLPIKYSGFQNIVNNSKGNVVTSSSNDGNIKVVVFGNNSTLDVHIINKNTNDNTVNLQLLNDYRANGVVTRKIWTSTDIGTSSTYNITDVSDWSITVPKTSYSHLKFDLNMSVLDVDDVFREEKQFIKITPNPSNGNFQLNLPLINDLEDVVIKIYSLVGKEVYSETRNYDSKIVLNKKLSSGMYIISVKAGANVFKDKIIIKD